MTGPEIVTRLFGRVPNSQSQGRAMEIARRLSLHTPESLHQPHHVKPLCDGAFRKLASNLFGNGEVVQTSEDRRMTEVQIETSGCLTGGKPPGAAEVIDEAERRIKFLFEAGRRE